MQVDRNYKRIVEMYVYIYIHIFICICIVFLTEMYSRSHVKGTSFTNYPWIILSIEKCQEIIKKNTLRQW